MSDIKKNVNCSECNKIIEFGRQIILDMDNNPYCSRICFIKHYDCKEMTLDDEVLKKVRIK